MARPPAGAHGGDGYVYVEVLLSALLVAVLLVPGLDALHAGISGGASAETASRQLRLREKMEQVLAVPFASLYAQTYLAGGNTMSSVSAAYSDPPGAPDRRLVVLYRYDAIAGVLAAGDTGLVYVRVYYEAEGGAAALDTLTGRWW